MTKPTIRSPFPNLEALINAIGMVIQVLRGGRYFFRPANGGPGQAYVEMRYLELLRQVISDAAQPRPRHFANFPLEVYRDIMNAASDTDCSTRWVIRQLQVLAIVKSSGQYGHRDKLVEFLRCLAKRLNKTRDSQAR